MPCCSFAITQFKFLLESATSEQNETEKWDLIMDICDKAGKSSEDAKNYLKCILKRLNNADPHVAIQAVTVSYETLRYNYY